MIDSEKLQTLLVLGIDQEELQKMIEKQRMPNHEQLMGIIDKYRPEYAAVPGKIYDASGKRLRRKMAVNCQCHCKRYLLLMEKPMTDR